MIKIFRFIANIICFLSIIVFYLISTYLFVKIFILGHYIATDTLTTYIVVSHAILLCGVISWWIEKICEQKIISGKYEKSMLEDTEKKDSILFYIKYYANMIVFPILYLISLFVLSDNVIFYFNKASNDHPIFLLTVILFIQAVVFYILVQSMIKVRQEKKTRQLNFYVIARDNMRYSDQIYVPHSNIKDISSVRENSMNSNYHLPQELISSTRVRVINGYRIIEKYDYKTGESTVRKYKLDDIENN